MNQDKRCRLSIDVTGGGPTGLALALGLCAHQVPAEIRVFEPRWYRDGDRVAWRDVEQGNRRRQQIVTLQSNVWTNLPEEVQRALFECQDYTEMWPYGPDSPPHRGRPRNLPIRAIEDRLLDLLQTKPNVTLIPERYEPSHIAGRQLLAICEGARSATREHFLDHFGRPHPDLYRLEGAEPHEEIILGMQVETCASDAEGVLLTASQNRYLLNTRWGRGFLNMRLTKDEASELVGLGDMGPMQCMRGHSCVMMRAGRVYRCSMHEAIFKPCIDPMSYLWPRMKEGLRLFGVEEERLLAIVAFRFSLVNRPRFTAELARDTWGCLLGDAANAIHLWPGRGLNTGLKSADSLARCLARRWNGAQLRAADLFEHEGVMHMLQFREIDNRAWRTMEMRDEDGIPRSIDERITRGLTGACDRAALTEKLLDRMRTMRARLEGRMDALPDDQLLRARLAGLSERTLKILVETGPWVASEVGGPEVDVAAMLPLPANRRTPGMWPRQQNLWAKTAQVNG